MISTAAVSTVSWCLCVVVFSVSLLGSRYKKNNNTPTKYQLSRFERKGGKHVFIDWLPVDSQRSNEKQLNSWHWFLFASREPSISWYASHSAEMLPFSHFSYPHNHQHFCLPDMKTNEDWVPLRVCVVSNPPVSNHWVGDSHKLHFRSL